MSTCIQQNMVFTTRLISTRLFCQSITSYIEREKKFEGGALDFWIGSNNVKIKPDINQGANDW